MMRRPTSTDVAHGDGERKTTAVFRHSAADSQLSARAVSRALQLSSLPSSRVQYVPAVTPAEPAPFQPSLYYHHIL